MWLPGNIQQLDDESTVHVMPNLTHSTNGLLPSYLTKLINYPTVSHNFTTLCNDYTSLSMLLIVLLALLMKLSKFLQSDSGTSNSFFTPSFFICFAHKQKCLCACVFSSFCFIYAFISLCRCKSCLLIPFRCVIYHAEAM